MKKIIRVITSIGLSMMILVGQFGMVKAANLETEKRLYDQFIQRVDSLFGPNGVYADELAYASLISASNQVVYEASKNQVTLRQALEIFKSMDLSYFIDIAKVSEDKVFDGSYLGEQLPRYDLTFNEIAAAYEAGGGVLNPPKPDGLRTIGKTTYLFNSKGEKQMGWRKLNLEDYYFSPEHGGGMLTGVRKIGQTVYLLSSEGKRYGWHRLNGKDYYFAPEFGGGMITGMRKIGQTTYLLTSQGKKTGWHRINGKDYYFSPEHGCGMLTGMRKIGNTTYLFNENGEKQTGWHKINGKNYYFSTVNGALLTR